MTPTALPPRGASCPPVIELERAVAQEAVPEVTLHLEQCDTCRAFVERTVAEVQAFQRARPPERFLAQLDARQQRPRRWVPLVAVGALAAAAALVVSMPPPTPVTFKGSLLSISVKRGDVITSVKPGDPLRANDALRFSITTPRPGFALVLNRDGTNAVRVVAPFDAREPQGVPEGTTVLDDAAVLDATRGSERFVAVFAERPFDVTAALRQLESTGSVSCAGCTIDAQSFDKP